MSFSRLLYHLVFTTKFRQPTITPERERRVYALLFSLMKKQNAVVHRIGGMPDHIHICVTIPPTISISSFIKYIKQGSSVAIKESRILDKWNGWQEGYGCFSYSLKELDNIVNYIKKQKEHHRKISFIEEYRKWLIDNGVSPDVPYFPK